MGTHPIFESDFDCLTDSEKSIITKCLTRWRLKRHPRRSRIKSRRWPLMSNKRAKSPRVVTQPPQVAPPKRRKKRKRRRSQQRPPKELKEKIMITRVPMNQRKVEMRAKRAPRK